MMRRIQGCLLLCLSLLMCGCDHSVESARDRMELKKLRVEVADLQMRLALAEKRSASKGNGYLEELEKLDALKTRGILTPEEFNRQKAMVLERRPDPMAEAPQSTSVSEMDELAKQLQALSALYVNSSISQADRDAKKTQLISLPLRTVDMKRDVETVQSLYTRSVITIQERDVLRQKLLGLNVENK